jgi:hypothetical protein
MDVIAMKTWTISSQIETQLEEQHFLGFGTSGPICVYRDKTLSAVTAFYGTGLLRHRSPGSVESLRTKLGTGPVGYEYDTYQASSAAS